MISSPLFSARLPVAGNLSPGTALARFQPSQRHSRRVACASAHLSGQASAIHASTTHETEELNMINMAVAFVADAAALIWSVSVRVAGFIEGVLAANAGGVPMYYPLINIILVAILLLLPALVVAIEEGRKAPREREFRSAGSGVIDEKNGGSCT